MNERLEVDNLRNDHVTLWSELEYLIRAKVMIVKCRVFGGNTGPIAKVQILCGKVCCNSSAQVPTLTQSCSSELELLPTLGVDRLIYISHTDMEEEHQ